ncbi:hypothetical protein NSP_14840 [Nodularia spumigena CCY9414]|nr:hypothetical protein NSP_14840 [Nodularia spumigena CCY9414]
MLQTAKSQWGNCVLCDDGNVKYISLSKLQGILHDSPSW